MTERVVRGLKLSLSEAVTYYPEQPAFITPESPESDFTRGIQARRNNSLNNVTRAQGSYAITPLTQLNASYSFQTRRYLGQPSTSDPSVPLELFNNTIHSVSAGPMYSITPSHAIGASYAYRQMLFESTTGARASSSSVIHGGSMIWQSTLSRELSAEIAPGISILASIPDRLIWTMRAGLRWHGDRTAVAISYTRGLYPSFFAQAGVLVSNVVGATLTYSLTSQWSVVLGGNYAHNTRTGQVDLQFESIGVNGALRYTIYPGITMSVVGRHGDFTIENSGSTFNYDRQMGMVSLSAEWN